MAVVRVSEEEIELMLLALGDFKRFTLQEYDADSKSSIAKEVDALIRKLRDA